MEQHTVGFVIFEDFQPLDLVGPHEVFRTAGYRCRIIAPRPGLVRSRNGLAVHAEYGVADVAADKVDTLVVAGGAGVDQARGDRALVDWVASAGAVVRRMTSVCSGVFLLAAAGLLAGRRVTTHWARRDQLVAEHPELVVDCDPIFNPGRQVLDLGGRDGRDGPRARAGRGRPRQGGRAPGGQ